MLCCAFLVRELMFSSYLRSWERIVPRKRKDAVFFLKSTTISTVLRPLSSKLFWLHQVTRLSASQL